MSETFDSSDDRTWTERFHAARARISPWTRTTPLIGSPALSRRFERPIYLKCENLQVSGSFKARPAFASILSDIETARRNGIVCSSSGNFGTAVAYAAHHLGLKATVVAPPATTQFKIDQIRRFGAEIVTCGAKYADRQETVDRLKAERGAMEVHPHSSVPTISGDGTLGLELIEALPQMGTVFCPISGGGLLAGVATAVKAVSPRVQVIGVQSAGNPSSAVSFAEKRRVTLPEPSTIADGLVATAPGELPLSIILRKVDDILTVDDAEIVAAMRRLFDEERLLVEPSAAVSLAALEKIPHQKMPGPVVCVLTGANVDPARWFSLYR